MHDYVMKQAVGATLGGQSIGDQYAPAKEQGLLDQIVNIADRLNSLANQLDTTADRVGGPTPQAVNSAGQLSNATPQMPNLASAIRMVKDCLSRAEYEANRIASVL